MRHSKTEQVRRRRMQILQRECKRKTFCVISVANKNNNNRDINAANKKGLKKVVILTELTELELPLYHLLSCTLKLKYIKKQK